MNPAGPMIEADTSVQFAPALIYKSRDGWPIQWTVEIDTIAKRLRLFRTWFGRWTKIQLDSALDDCVAVGTVEYNNDGYLVYGTYFKLRNGLWHAIPMRGNSFEEALQVVKQVSTTTGIPRHDVKYS